MRDIAILDQHQIQYTVQNIIGPVAVVSLPTVDQMPPSVKSVPLIKGYLPVCLRLPDAAAAAAATGENVDRDDDDDDDDETTTTATATTFIYVKEHYQNSSSITPQQQQSTPQASSNTLFVANCPTVLGCRTKLLLQSIFGRYGEVTRVTVIANPRQQQQQQWVEDALPEWTSKFATPTYHHPTAQVAEGKFAHVVFTTHKEMKRTFKALQEIMSGSTRNKKDSPLPAVTVDKIELQTLSDETERQWRQELDFNDDDDDDDDDAATKRLTAAAATAGGIVAVAARYRAAVQRLSSPRGRNELLAECNAVVEAYEVNVEAAEIQRQRDNAVPDSDGFVTVSSSHQNSNTAKRELQDRRGRGTGSHPRHQNKKKKGMGGAEPLPDFYRFQTREHRKKSLQELRQRFEEDLVQVKRMKEERQYRPF